MKSQEKQSRKFTKSDVKTIVIFIILILIVYKIMVPFHYSEKTLKSGSVEDRTEGMFEEKHWSWWKAKLGKGSYIGRGRAGELEVNSGQYDLTFFGYYTREGYDSIQLSIKNLRFGYILNEEEYMARISILDLNNPNILGVNILKRVEEKYEYLGQFRIEYNGEETSVIVKRYNYEDLATFITGEEAEAMFQACYGAPSIDAVERAKVEYDKYVALLDEATEHFYPGFLASLEEKNPRRSRKWYKLDKSRHL